MVQPLVLLRRFAARPLWLLLAAAAIIAIFADHARKASMVIDGVRWFWLDDDQMISMRYARNLAEGAGLVWNPGERVEGYTNFGWTLLMALVHLFGLPDRLTALAMTGVSCALCLGLTLAAASLLSRLESRHLALTLPCALLCIVTCTDVMFWAASGFETVLVTLLHLWVVRGALSGCALDWKLFAPLSLIPIVRSDGAHIWLGDALLVASLCADRRRAALWLCGSLIPLSLHLGFRLAYYGDLLPNTYYLKVAGLDQPWTRGLRYVSGFAQRYWLPLVFAGASALSRWRTDRRALGLVTSLLPPLLYAVHVGGDVFNPFRFFAHVMPELFVWGALGAGSLLTTPFARVAWLVALAGFSTPPWRDPLAHIAPVGNNGDPYDQIVVAAELRKNAATNASVAVIPAGIVPYFTRLEALDLLGKTDAHIAHLAPQRGAALGHGKVDPAYSFAKRPDYVVSCRPRAVAQTLAPLPPEGSPDYVWTLLASPAFRRDWEPYPVSDPYLLERTAVYVRADSPERAKISAWNGVTLAR